MATYPRKGHRRPKGLNRQLVLDTQRRMSTAGQAYTAQSIANEVGVSDSLVRKYWDSEKAKTDGAARFAPKQTVREHRRNANPKRSTQSGNTAVNTANELGAQVLDVRSTYIPKSSEKQLSAPLPNDRAYVTVHGKAPEPLPSPRTKGTKTSMFVTNTELNEVNVPAEVASFGQLDEELRRAKPSHRVLPISRVDGVLVLGEPTYGERVGVLVTKVNDAGAQAELDAYLAWERGESYGFIGVETDKEPLICQDFFTRKAAEDEAKVWALKEESAA